MGHAALKRAGCVWSRWWCAVQTFTLPRYPYAPVRALNDDEMPPLPDDPEGGIVGRAAAAAAAAASAAAAGPDPALAGTLPKANTPPLRYQQPELCNRLLKHIKAVNGDRLQQVPVGTAWKFGSRALSTGSTLADLVQLGSDSVSQSPAVASALLQELATQTTYGSAGR